MDQCNQDVADTRLLVHLLHALNTSSLVIVHTGDTDVVVILLSKFHHIKAMKLKRRIQQYWTPWAISPQTWARQRAKPWPCSMHSLGQTVSSLMGEFANIVDTPFQPSWLKEMATNWVYRLLRVIRMRVFSQKTRDLERIPSMRDALNQHHNRHVLQASMSTTAQMYMMPVNNPTNHGWKEEDDKLLHSWTSLPLANDVKCICTSTYSWCKYMRDKLNCTRLCKCKFEK